MSKKFRKIMATLTVLSMMVNAMPAVIAEGGEETAASSEIVTTVEENKSETKTEEKKDEASGESLTVTTTTTTDDNGKGTVTVTIEKEWTNESEESSEPEAPSEPESSATPELPETDSEETDSEEESGIVINGEETTVITDTPTETTEEVDGSETREWTEEDTGDEEGQPEVNVDLIPGETTTGTAKSTEITGDVQNGENDENYDYTETTTTEREVTADTSEIEATVNDPSTGLVGEQETHLKGMEPVYDKDENGNNIDKEDVFDNNYLASKTVNKVTLENGIVIWVNTSNILTNITIPEGAKLPEDFTYSIGDNVATWYKSQSKDTKTTNVAINDIDNWYDEDGKLIHAPMEGAEFAYVGTGEHSKFYNARVTVIYKKDENGNTIFDEEGKPVIESIQKANGTPVTINGVPATELPDGVSLKPIYDDYNGARPTIFMLMDKNGDRVYAYCCDMGTETSNGYWYSVANLEDSNYYANEESEAHIRTIVTNGYWGTSDVQKEDGSYETGSLEKIKNDLKAAINSGKMENTLISIPVLDETGNPVVDENGNPVTESKYMLDIIDDLSAGEALLATQSAIWSYSNGSIATQNGKDGLVLIDPDAYTWNHDPNDSNKNGEAMDDWGSARVDFLYNWLITLETQESSTIIINEKNNVKDVSLTVKDKVADENIKENYDDNKDNDVYNTELNFKLAFIPGANDDLLVQISYTDLDGNLVSVIRRLAGDKDDYTGITPDADGNYTITGLKLSENDPFGFDIRLEGTQYLEQGVYIYQAVGGRDAAQTMVGLAEGNRNVDVTVGMTITFDVDEDDKVVAERKWHKKTTRSKSTPGGNTPGGNTPGGNNPGGSAPEYPVSLTNNDPDGTIIGEEPVPLSGEAPVTEDGLVEILDEEVPLAAVPQTGDNSLIFALMSMFSLAGIVFLSKKREIAE